MTTIATKRCWCGAETLAAFGEGYLECAACATLVRAEQPADVTRVRDEERDLYGRGYWFAHQAELGKADLVARSTADLPERCLHWLETTLRYRLPPGRALELGSAHGAFTALLARAGFDATGLELSPWVAEWARRAFGVPVLEGPLEDQELEPGSFDLVAAMDVLEHLPDPLDTMTRAAKLLADDGVLLLQTPQRPPGRSLEELRADAHRFPEMLLPEHLHLFTRDSVRELLRRCDLGEVVFETPLFAHYDMFLVASRRPLDSHRDEEVRERLLGRPDSRFVAALMDLRTESDDTRRQLEELRRDYLRADDDRVRRQQRIEELNDAYAQADADRTARQQQVEELRDAYARADADRTARQRQVEELRVALAEADADRTARQRQVEELRDAYVRADADRIARQQQIEELGAALGQAEADRRALQQQIEELRDAYVRADADRIARQQQVEELGAALGQAETDRRALQQQIEELRDAYAQADADRTARQQLIEELNAILEGERLERRNAETRLERQLADLKGQVEGLKQQADDLEACLDQVERERDDSARQRTEARASLEHAEAECAGLRQQVDALRGRHEALEERHAHLRGLALDHRNSRVYRSMVRLGRWRDFDRRLVRVAGDRSARQPEPAEAREIAWTIESHGEHPGEGPIAVDLTALLPGGENGGAKLVATTLVREMAGLAPERDFVVLAADPCHEELAELDARNVVRRRVASDPDGVVSVLAGAPFGLVFCPMTAPPWIDPRSPYVCLVHDLQYLSFPDFFDDAERSARDAAFRRALHASERIVTHSGYVRRTVMEESGRDGGAARPDSDGVVTIPIGFSDRFPELEPSEVDAALERYELERNRFFLYPANFWPHKNHRMLLTAFGQFHHRRHTREDAGEDWKLVLTGAERPDPEPILQAARRMGLEAAVRVTGFISDRDLAALLRGCRGLVFPSLYEGFGMPVIEAMACGRPVACSDVTSLPEVAGSAALLFDPRKPAEIAAAMERLAEDGELVRTLTAAGLERVREIGDSARMARAYLDVLEAVLGAPRRFRDRLAGVYGDAWTAGRLVVSHTGAGPELELGLTNPRGETVAVETGPGGAPRRLELEPGGSALLRCRFPEEPGYLELDVHPTFRPAATGSSADERDLGLRIWACRLRGPGADVDLLA